MIKSTSGPTKQEIETVFARLRALSANKSCFDCDARAPTWSSVTYGVFICIDCSAVHRSLGVHLTFVRSTTLDTNWTWLQLRQMQLGGNANASQFFRQHDCVATDAQLKYNSRAAQLYRDKLAKLAQQALTIHGTKLFWDNVADKTDDNAVGSKLINKEIDFFANCEIDNKDDSAFDNNNSCDGSINYLSEVQLAKVELKSSNNENLANLSTAVPNVDLLNTVVTPEAVKSSIGVRKLQPKKMGLGARKGGLGATKVNTNFAEIEERANQTGQFKEVPTTLSAKTTENELDSMASMRLAYQDLSLQKTRKEEKLKTVDPAKAKQIERLGMGFNFRGSDVSHSALSDMETIQQVANPKTVIPSKNTGFESNDGFFNDFPSSIYNKSGNNSLNNTVGGFSASSSKIDKEELETLGFETIEDMHSTGITSMFGASEDNFKSQHAKPSAIDVGVDYRKKNTTNKNSNSNSNDDNIAQKKFGNAKGFGSNQYFDREDSQRSPSMNLSRFQGSNSISSADYFGDASNDGQLRGYPPTMNFQAPDLDDVKESVRQGVHKVADRLSSLANDVMSSLQDKYGY